MSGICQVTKKKRQVGHKVSHSNRKKKREFKANLHYQRFWVESAQKYIRLLVSNKGQRIINKKGIEQVLSEIVNEAC